MYRVYYNEADSASDLTAAKVLGMTRGNFGRSNFCELGMSNKLNDPSRCNGGYDFPCAGSAIMM